MHKDSDDPCDDITGKDLSKWLKQRLKQNDKHSMSEMG
jgi:hypothetical protein